MIAPAHDGRQGVFDYQQCPPRLQCRGEQHTGSDRIHAARNGEEPTIQFGTRLLIGLQQHPRRRRHQRHSHYEEKASEAATTRKMITRTRCGVPARLAAGFPESHRSYSGRPS
jgi:hypothetical protein